MTSNELRQKFLDFFEEKGHKVIPSASLVPENDPTVLFTTAGMHPLVPYIMGEAHPKGKRLTDSQKCIRTDDIEEVGDKVHHTFFEMLGNWSFGDYFKEDAIKFSYEFLTDEKWLGIDKEKLAVTVFEGDKDAPFDEESYNIWISLGISKDRVAKLGKKDNWWGPAGETGPCGSDTEMFYWSGKEKAPEKFDPKDDRWVEIWNDVFMQYEKKKRVIIADGMNCLIEKETNKLDIKLAELLAQYNTRVIVATNADEERIRQSLGDFNSEIFTLNQEVKKTDTKYYKKLLERFDLEADEVICFEFRKERAETAAKVGIKTEQYTGIEQVKAFIDENQYYFASLKQKNVDTGMGLERTLAILNGSDDDYQTDLFLPIIEKIEEISGKKYEEKKKEFCVIADHLRAAVFAINDGVVPSNKQAGYIIRRLIRRAIVKGHRLGINDNFTADFVDIVAKIYGEVYKLNTDVVKKELQSEEEKFRKTLKRGLVFLKKELEKVNEFREDKEILAGKRAYLIKDLASIAFNMFQSYGFPLEMTQEVINEIFAKEEYGLTVDLVLLKRDFDKEFKKHQELSRTASAGMFKGGLADASEASTKYHTAVHLLLAALQDVLGDDVHQRGSNITPERLRLDFSHPDKLTDEERKKVEDWVNDKIEKKLEVHTEECDPKTAKSKGAEGEFADKYGDRVKVYSIGGDLDSKDAVSKEICGGPHIKNTSELGHFRIKNETSSSKGVRRIKAVLE